MSDINVLKVGFSRVNVTPPMGINISGYFKIRLADGVLDDLEVNAVAANVKNKTVLLLTVDNCGIRASILNEFRVRISEKTGVPTEAIFISATHTHTGPSMPPITDPEAGDGKLEEEYKEFLCKRAIDASVFAIADMKPAKTGIGVGVAPNISFVRRFRMKDGSVATNPGPDNPDIVAPIGDVDERVNIIRFDRDGAETIVVVNFADHPDVVGGNKISADWPGFLRKYTEKALDNVKCIFFNGALGDVNHVNVHPRGGDLNDMFLDFDDVERGYGHAKHMGKVVTGAVMQVYDKVEYIDVDNIHFMQRDIKVPSNKPTAEEMPLAIKYNELHKAGKDSEIPYKGMMLTTVVAESERKVKLEHGPDFFEMPLSGVAIGDIAFVGIPGEPFTGIGRGIKETDGWRMICPCCLTNGSEGYFPMKEAYDEGGYETGSSSFKSGVAELIIDEGKKLLSNLK